MQIARTWQLILVQFLMGRPTCVFLLINIILVQFIPLTSAILDGLSQLGIEVKRLIMLLRL